MSRPSLLSGDTLVSAFSSLLSEAPPTRKADRKTQENNALRAREHHEGYTFGYEEGLAAGREAGFAAANEAASAEHRKVLDQFTHDLAHIEELVRHAMDAWFKIAEEEVEKVVASIAREVLKQELELSRSSITSIVRAALKDVTLSRDARIRVNPMDVPSLAEAKKELMAACESLRTIEIVDDPSILGGCIIETDGGLVEATIEGQLDRLEAA